jgi:DNA invertase Pin-like site-specific DNA recombinase
VRGRPGLAPADAPPRVLLIEEFERARVTVEFMTLSTEATPEGRLPPQVKGGISEYEREKIRERTDRGKREKARRGSLSPAFRSGTTRPSGDERGSEMWWYGPVHRPRHRGDAGRGQLLPATAQRSTRQTIYEQLEQFVSTPRGAFELGLRRPHGRQAHRETRSLDPAAGDFQEGPRAGAAGRSGRGRYRGTRSRRRRARG